MPDRAIEAQTFAGTATELSILAKAILSSVSRALDVVWPHQFCPAELNTCKIFLAFNIHTCIHTHIYICVCVYVYIYVCVCVRLGRQLFTDKEKGIENNIVILITGKGSANSAEQLE